MFIDGVWIFFSFERMFEEYKKLDDGFFKAIILMLGSLLGPGIFILSKMIGIFWIMLGILYGFTFGFLKTKKTLAICLFFVLLIFSMPNLLETKNLFFSQINGIKDFFYEY